MFSRIKPIVKKEFRQIARDRRLLGLLVFLPVFLLIMFGYALNFDVKHISLAVYDEDKSGTSREFIQNFLHSEYFDLRYSLEKREEIDRVLDESRANAVLVVPEDFSENLLSGKDASVQILIDGSNANSASTVIGYVNGIVQSYSLKILTEGFIRKRGMSISIPIDFRPRIWFNPELKSSRFLVPGLIAFIMMINAVISTSMSIVREKEKGTMEQIIVSPVKPIELIVGKVIPYIFLSLISTYLILLVGYFLFEVMVKGSHLLLFIVILLYLFCALGMGLFISTISETQQVAFQLSALLTLLPTFILSGFVFPIRNMPIAIQVFTYLVPARYFLVALRAVILKGAGLSAFFEQFIFLFCFALAMVSLSWLGMSKKRL